MKRQETKPKASKNLVDATPYILKTWDEYIANLHATDRKAIFLLIINISVLAFVLDLVAPNLVSIFMENPEHIFALRVLITIFAVGLLYIVISCFKVYRSVISNETNNILEEDEGTNIDIDRVLETLCKNRSLIREKAVLTASSVDFALAGIMATFSSATGLLII